MTAEFLSKANGNLAAARLCFDNGLFDASTNRAYFAAFQAAISALLFSGQKPGKFDHKWVQAKSGELLIKRQKRFPAKFKSYLMEMQSLRNRADYRHESVGKNKALIQLGKAGELVEMIGKKLEK